MELEKQGPPEEAEDRFSMPLIITIICMASFLLLVAALYGCCHQRLSQRKDQVRVHSTVVGESETSPPYQHTYTHSTPAFLKTQGGSRSF